MADRIRFLCDEHVPDAVAAALRRRGVDVLTIAEAGAVPPTSISLPSPGRRVV